MAKPAAAEPFSIRGYAMRMRAVDAAECYPFVGGCCGEGEGEPPPPPPPRFPPMDPKPLSRWWQHELAAGQARLLAGAKGGEAVAAGGRGGALRKRGTKRKGSRSSSTGERTRKRRRVLQFRSFLTNKERTAKPQSTSRLHEHKLHMALLRKHKSSTVHTNTEIEPRKKLEEACDRMPGHENSVRNRERTNPSSEMNSDLFVIKEVTLVTSCENKQAIEVNGSTNNPTNTGCDMVKTFTGPKDDIFGDLPLLELESSKVMFRTGVHELPTVIEESFITNQTVADSIPEAVPLELIDASDITAQTPSPLEDLVKGDDTELASISHNAVAGSHPSTVGIDGLPNQKNVNMVKPGLGDMQLKFTDVSALGSHSVLRSKCGSGNPLQGCFDVNKNCSQEIRKHGTNSTSSSPAMRTRTEETKYKDAPVKGKKSTEITSAVIALPAPANKLSYRASVMPSPVSQTVFSTRVDSNDMSSFRSMAAKECVPTTRPGNFRTNVCHGSRKHVDPCAALSTDNQGSSHSKLHPICSPANIGMAFMKIPGLERMEISNCNVKMGENRFSNAESMNAVRYQKQQLLSGMTHIMQGQKQMGLSTSQVGKPALDGYGGQGDHHLQQPTVRLMGKTVSVWSHSHSKDHNVSTMDQVSPDNVAIGTSRLSSISCQLPQRRSFPSQDSVTPRVHLNNSSDFLGRIANNLVPGQNTTFSDLHNQRPQPISSAPTVKDCTWNFGNQFVHQAELNKASIVSTNSQTRHVELHQPPQLISIPQHLWTPAAHMSRKDQCFVGPAVNQSSPVPKSLLNASMKEKYQKSTLLSYNDPSSVPIRQPYQIPGAESSSASVISFFEYGANNSLSRSSSPGLSLSLATGLANECVSTGRAACAGSLTNADGWKAASFAEPISNRTAYATDNVSVSQQPAKRQLVTDTQDFMSLGPNIVNHSPGWSLSDAVGPQVLDFSKRIARDAVQTSRNESNNPRASSGPVLPIETWSSPGVVPGANTMLKPGQNLNDHSKLLYSKFSVDSGINSVVL